MKSSLITPSDLLTSSNDDDLRTHVLKLQAAARVLEQSIKAQRDVANSVENQPDLYAVAVRVVEGLMDSYAQTVLQSALLDLQSLLGGELQVAMFLTQMANQIRVNAAQQAQAANNQGQPPTGSVPVSNVFNMDGTPVAIENSNDEANQPDEDNNETIH